MKRILGLDLGSSSIGWALVNEAEKNTEQSDILRLGVRVNPLTTDEQTNFEKGKPITTTADRTEKRSMRRNLQRYKMRRDALVSLLKERGFICEKDLLSEQGNRTTFETLRLRAKAAMERIELRELARVLLAINKKRGYKSSRKANDSEDGEIIDSMDVTKEMQDSGQTPGQFVYRRLCDGKRGIPTFYRSDLKDEFDKVFGYQSQFYPEILTDEFYRQIVGRGKTDTSKRFFAIKNIETAENKGKDRHLMSYKWRSEAVDRQMSMDVVAYVLCEINGNMASSSGYLSSIGDRSKVLRMNGWTVGQYMVGQLEQNPHYSFRNEVFYRNDYLDEFERIWECQSRYHKELTPELRRDVRDIVIFYQRNLKSQKGLVSLCEFEKFEVDVKDANGENKTKTVGRRVAPKSSLMFQEFKIWQVLNNLMVEPKGYRSIPEQGAEDDGVVRCKRTLLQEEKVLLYTELKYRESMKDTDVLKLLFVNHKDLKLNYEKVEGNRTVAAIYDAVVSVIEQSGHETLDIKKVGARKAIAHTKQVMTVLGVNTEIMDYSVELPKEEYEAQPLYRLWHLLYSFESDSTPTGNGKLIERIVALTGLEPEYARVLSRVRLQPDYGSLSEKAMRRILSWLKQGYEYSEACEKAGYRHSTRSLTREELDAREYADSLELLPKNSLRNPVVDKIINQMIHVVNGVIAQYGKPDEIRIELARELKQSAKERDEATKGISVNTKRNEEIKQILHDEFGLSYVSKTDIVRYRLWDELKENGYKALYSGKMISREILFSKEIDIEHIIPQAKIFDDSYSNKTLEFRDVNIEKSNKTAYDYVKDKYGDGGVKKYTDIVNGLSALSTAKRRKLLMCEADIQSGFIDRDLRNTQYISRKAREILESIVPRVVSTTGSVTRQLREDWQLVNVMQELNWDKYDLQGLTYYETNCEGQRLPRIKDWTKRNDHRHHAMDALTIAFTKESYIQYLNNRNARGDRNGVIHAIEQKELVRNQNGKLVFRPPMPIGQFRMEARRHLENILVSVKAKNKVVTQNTNNIKTKKGVVSRVQLTPRGSLHEATIYGKIQCYEKKPVRINAKFGIDQIALIAKPIYRKVLMERLEEYHGNAAVAFGGKNSLDKNPIYIDRENDIKMPLSVECVRLVERYTIRKQIDKDLKVDKVVDSGIRDILQQRLDEYGGNADKAFSNLDERPIWLNEEKGIVIKRVTIFASVDNLIALHDKRDKDGNIITDMEGRKCRVDYIKPGNNHHVAIFEDEKGNYQEHIVTMFEATQRANAGLPIVDRQYNSDKGWKFRFTMKQNEYFVFPRYDGNGECIFDPLSLDLKDPANYSVVSPNLFRVQKMSSKDYVFRHHLETTVDNEDKNLRNITWKRVTKIGNLQGIVKVRVNHIGQIVDVGEY